MTKECLHLNTTVPSLLAGIPRLGIVGKVKCEDCNEYVEECEWVETSYLNFELIFRPIKEKL